jgi:hypothetical protein
MSWCADIICMLITSHSLVIMLAPVSATWAAGNNDSLLHVHALNIDTSYVTVLCSPLSCQAHHWHAANLQVAACGSCRQLWQVAPTIWPSAPTMKSLCHFSSRGMHFSAPLQCKRTATVAKGMFICKAIYAFDARCLLLCQRDHHCSMCWH